MVNVHRFTAILAWQRKNELEENTQAGNAKTPVPDDEDIFLDYLILKCAFAQLSICVLV